MRNWSDFWPKMGKKSRKNLKICLKNEFKREGRENPKGGGVTGCGVVEGIGRYRFNIWRFAWGHSTLLTHTSTNRTTSKQLHHHPSFIAFKCKNEVIFALKRVKNPEKSLKFGSKMRLNAKGERARACVGGEVCRMMCSVPRGMVGKT